LVDNQFGIGVGLCTPVARGIAVMNIEGCCPTPLPNNSNSFADSADKAIYQPHDIYERNMLFPPTEKPPSNLQMQFANLLGPALEAVR
jgi:hypothetical protein